jgi:ubiquitin-protein ligase
MFGCHKNTSTNTSRTASLSKQAQRQVAKDLKELADSPGDDLDITPIGDDLSNLLFVFKGPDQSDFAGGIYFGTIKIPDNYPLTPPVVRFKTPSGRFAVNRTFCSSIVGIWNPSLRLSTLMRTVITLMADDNSFPEGHKIGALIIGGHILETKEKRQLLAKDSMKFNMNHQDFREAFPLWACKYGKDVQPDPTWGSWFKGWLAACPGVSPGLAFYNKYMQPKDSK